MIKEGQPKKLVDNLLAGLGFVLIGASIFLSMSQLVLAGTQTYTEDWLATEYFHAKIGWPKQTYISDSYGSGYFCLGPSKWKVEGTMGSTSFAETWSLYNVQFQWAKVGGENEGSESVSVSVNSTDAKKTIYCAEGITANGGDNSDRLPGMGSSIYKIGTPNGIYGVINNGPYGGWITPFTTGKLDSYWPGKYNATFRIIPTEWSITGTVTTP